MSKFDRMVEYGLDGGLLRRDLRGPRNGDARERFGNKETVPGAKFPSLLGVGVEGAYGCIDEFRKLGDARFGDLSRTTGTIGGDSAVVTGEVGTLKVAEAAGSVAGTGASNGNEAQALDGAGDKFAVEAATDKDGDAIVAEAPGAGEKTAMPEGVDRRWRRVVTRIGSGIADVAVAKCHAKAADGHARQARDNGEGDTLLKSEGLGHKVEFIVTGYSAHSLV